MREAIVTTFEYLCMALVLVPTGIGLLLAYDHPTPFNAGMAVIIFLSTTFLAGGALTLSDIAKNTRETLKLLRANGRKPSP